MQENILKIGFQSSECAGFLYLKILKAHHWLVVWKYESLFIIILSLDPSALSKIKKTYN
jgi:hypothetical protein